MNARCPDLLELDLILALPETDSRRQHLAQCPNCRGRIEAMELFLDPGDTPEPVALQAADAELAARLERSFPPARRARAPRGRRFGLAVAAVLALVALGITTNEILRTGRLDPVDIGQVQRGPEAREAVRVNAGAEGTELTWPTAPAADEIVYLFFADDMSEVGRRAASGPLVIAPDDPLSAASYCQAIAVESGDVVARSPLSRLLPDPE